MLTYELFLNGESTGITNTSEYWICSLMRDMANAAILTAYPKPMAIKFVGHYTVIMEFEGKPIEYRVEIQPLEEQEDEGE